MLKVLVVLPVIQASKEHKVLKGTRVPRVHKELKVEILKELKVPKGVLVLVVTRVHLVLKVMAAMVEHKVLKEQPATQVILALKELKVRLTKVLPATPVQPATPVIPALLVLKAPPVIRAHKVLLVSKGILVPQVVSVLKVLKVHHQQVQRVTLAPKGLKVQLVIRERKGPKVLVEPQVP